VSIAHVLNDIYYTYANVHAFTTFELLSLKSARIDSTTYKHIKTIVLLFLCKYNTEHAELTFLFETYNSYNYVKINFVFTPNSRELCFSTCVESGQPAHP